MLHSLLCTSLVSFSIVHLIFLAYEIAKNIQHNYFADENGQLKFYNYLCAGGILMNNMFLEVACAGAVASSVTIPFDVVKAIIHFHLIM